MKIIPFFLPQYHNIPENDEWWEPGFTEWTNVRRAKPIFKNQNQPKVPLEGNYYNLLDKSTVEWQTNLMHQYGIYGFCYFHYWFKGRKLLEKPAENLLKWKDIDQKFCFAWANGSWARTWTAHKKATTNWVVDDRKATGDGVLLEQTYGEEGDWEEHYKYLRQFFLDDRYIKIDNKPVILIYHLEEISCSNEMFELWHKASKKDGFDGVYIISMNHYLPNMRYVCAITQYDNYTRYDKHIVREYYNAAIRKFKLPLKVAKTKLEYSKVWENILKEEPNKDIVTYLGGLVSYDETARKGINATYIENASPELFEKYLSLQIKKAKEICHTDIIFLDAWNEWGEGNYLEPDEEHGYAYLEVIKNVLN